jgi:hypothetical protein
MWRMMVTFALAEFEVPGAAEQDNSAGSECDFDGSAATRRGLALSHTALDLR